MYRKEAIQLLTVLSEQLDEAAKAGGKIRRNLGVKTADVLDAYAAKYGFDVAQQQLAASTGPKSRTTDPNTSKTANYHNAGRRGSQKRRILEAVVEAGVRGLTADEAAKVTRLPLNSVSTRFSELVRGGFVVYSQGGERRTERGEKATVYIPTPKGQAA